VLHKFADEHLYIQNLYISLHFNIDQHWNGRSHEFCSNLLLCRAHFYLMQTEYTQPFQKTSKVKDLSSVYPEKWLNETKDEENKSVKFKNRDPCNASLTTGNIEKRTFLGRYPSVGPGCIKCDIKCLGRTPYADLSIKLALWKKRKKKAITMEYRLVN
jgi:hypothetical protein